MLLTTNWKHLTSRRLAVVALALLGVQAAAAGEVRVSSEASVRKGIQEAARLFQKKSPATKFTITALNSTASIQLVENGQAEIAAFSRVLGESSAGEKTNEAIVAQEPIAIIVNANRGQALKKLIRRQVQQIFFTGGLTEFSRINPTLLGKINVYVRANDSDTGRIFAEAVNGESGSSTPIEGAKVVGSDAEMVKVVAGDENGIGYAPLSALTDQVTALGFGDDWAFVAQPTPENLNAGKYKLSRKTIFVTPKNVDKSVEEFIAFLATPEGQKALRSTK